MTLSRKEYKEGSNEDLNTYFREKNWETLKIWEISSVMRDSEKFTNYIKNNKYYTYIFKPQHRKDNLPESGYWLDFRDMWNSYIYL